jgi:hypothetical protein
MGPQEYMLRQRIEHAMQILRESNLSVKEVADRPGLWLRCRLHPRIPSRPRWHAAGVSSAVISGSKKQPASARLRRPFALDGNNPFLTPSFSAARRPIELPVFDALVSNPGEIILTTES